MSTHDDHDHHDHHGHHGQHGDGPGLARGHGHADHHDHAGDNHFGEMEIRVRAIETLLTEKGLVEPAAIDRIIQTYETRVGPRNGAQVVARAWSDPAFARWLADDATAAIASLGFTGRQGEHMVAVFNSVEEHHMVVCTLCSCYPWPVLGLPPAWYKSAPYRSRAVREPRAVLAEFGVTLPEATRVRVLDSTAEIRYLVIPMRPAGTQGWTEAQLAELVTRDSMIGTGLPAPAHASARSVDAAGDDVPHRPRQAGDTRTGLGEGSA